MKIVFDMDGVLKRISLGLLKACIHMDNYDAITLYRKTEGYPLLNPALVSLPSDELYVLTNCSNEKSADEKQRWLQHFYGDRMQFEWVSLSTTAWGKDYVDPVARAKLDKMYEIEADAYFDDDPAIVRVMREYNAEDLEAVKESARKITFFKWGPWIEEVY